MCVLVSERVRRTERECTRERESVGVSLLRALCVFHEKRLIVTDDRMEKNGMRRDDKKKRN